MLESDDETLIMVAVSNNCFDSVKKAAKLIAAFLITQYLFIIAVLTIRVLTIRVITIRRLRHHACSSLGRALLTAFTSAFSNSPSAKVINSECAAQK